MAFTMTQAFKAGDLKQLLAGGPVMTVSGATFPDQTKADYVHCPWFDRNTARSHFFSPQSLKKYEENADPADLLRAARPRVAKAAPEPSETG